MSDNISELKNFMNIALGFSFQPEDEAVHDDEYPTEQQDDLIIENNSEILQELRDLSFKLKSHMDMTGGEYSFGYDAAFAAAAEMIDNLIKRHEG